MERRDGLGLVVALDEVDDFAARRRRVDEDEDLGGLAPRRSSFRALEEPRRSRGRLSRRRGPAAARSRRSSRRLPRSPSASAVSSRAAAVVSSGAAAVVGFPGAAVVAFAGAGGGVAWSRGAAAAGGRGWWTRAGPLRRSGRRQRGGRAGCGEEEGLASYGDELREVVELLLEASWSMRSASSTTQTLTASRRLAAPDRARSGRRPGVATARLDRRAPRTAGPRRRAGAGDDADPGVGRTGRFLETAWTCAASSRVGRRRGRRVPRAASHAQAGGGPDAAPRRRGGPPSGPGAPRATPGAGPPSEPWISGARRRPLEGCGTTVDAVEGLAEGAGVLAAPDTTPRARSSSGLQRRPRGPPTASGSRRQGRLDAGAGAAADGAAAPALAAFAVAAARPSSCARPSRATRRSKCFFCFFCLFGGPLSSSRALKPPSAGATSPRFRPLSFFPMARKFFGLYRLPRPPSPQLRLRTAAAGPDDWAAPHK